MRKLLILLMILATPLYAVLPDEILPDAVQEARAREISIVLRCLVCRNENIDDSNAQLARDLRLLVRERIVLGDTNEQVIGYIVERYGEYVLLKPTFKGANLVLWAAPPAMAILALIVGIGFIRRRKSTGEEDLSPEEQARMAQILQE